MGCDIHIRAEIREGGVWKPAYPKCVRVWHEGSDWEHADKEATWPEPYSVRWYALFGLLADVRWPFAEAPYGSPEARAMALAPHRGLPDDLCSEYVAEQDRLFGDHSQTHFSLRDLFGYDWNRTFTDHREPGSPMKAGDIVLDFWTQAVSPLLALVHEKNLTLDDARFVCGFDS